MPMTFVLVPEEAADGSLASWPIFGGEASAARSIEATITADELELAVQVGIRELTLSVPDFTENGTAHQCTICYHAIIEAVLQKKMKAYILLELQVRRRP
jgi:hypothetical protein